MIKLFLNQQDRVMSIGKYLSLEEARKHKLLSRFCKEHPSQGDKNLFQRIFEAMATGVAPKKPEGYSE